MHRWIADMYCWCDLRNQSRFIHTVETLTEFDLDGFSQGILYMHIRYA